MSAFEQLREQLQTYLSADQINVVEKAYLFAAKAHQEQKRSSGEPYIHHPVEVAQILASMHLDVESIQAALLHDIIEDTEYDKEFVKKEFGEVVAALVDGVTKLTKIEFESKIEAQAENLQKMVMAMAHDIRVVLIKLADRLHNIRTLCYLDSQRQKRIARETLDIYAPIANRLGMHVFRTEFEDRGFEMLYPARYRVLREAVKIARGNRKEILGIIESSLKSALENSPIKDFQLSGREKHLYSIYQKMKSKRLKFSEVMDIYAFRIITTTVDECYLALGLAHNLYKPLPEHFDDYIAIPKTNGYQSLHTILFGPYGVPIEIQIRTRAMDKMAENGIAAHWLYKQEDDVSSKAQVRARDWIKGLLEIQKNAGSSIEFIENMKIDLFPDEVYVFTPQGDIVKLPAGSTMVDYAYAIHSDVGDFCVAGKIGNRYIPLSSKLQSGQTVEIITLPGGRPNPAWLDFVVTGRARSRIRKFLKHQKREESIQLGERLLVKAMRSYRKNMADIPQKEIERLLQRQNYQTIEDLYEDLGVGNQVPQLIVQRLLGKENLKVEELEPSEPLHIKGAEGLVLHFARCCHPVPGDPIRGVITAGHGIVIHYDGCRNLQEYAKQPEKYITLQWETGVSGQFEAELLLNIQNKPGMIAEIASRLADEDININQFNGFEKSDQTSQIRTTISVENKEHLTKIIKTLGRIKGVISIERNTNS